MNRIQSLTASDWGPSLHRAARVVGTVAAFLITIALVAGGCAYSLGRQLRLAIEARNDQLAAWWVGVLGLREPIASASAPVEAPAPARATPLLLPAAAPVLLLAAAIEPAAEPVPARAPRRRKATATATTPRKALSTSRKAATRRKALAAA